MHTAFIKGSEKMAIYNSFNDKQWKELITAIKQGGGGGGGGGEGITIIDAGIDETTGYFYRKYSDGWVEQGGVYIPVSMWMRDNHVILPVEMADTNYIILANEKSQGDGYSISNTVLTSATSTTEISLCYFNGGTVPIAWQVSGYSKEN